MQGYEIVTIVDPQIADEDVPKTSEKINEFITSRGGSIARVQRWGRRRLAYPLQRHTEAHYLLTTFAWNRSTLPNWRRTSSSPRKCLSTW